MAMTEREYIGKQEVHKILAENGYPTYANLFDMFDLHLTKDPKVVGYMNLSKGIITINEDLDLAQVSVIVRHEILHQYLNHAVRIEKHLGIDSIANMSQKDHEIFNIAGDYEISNRGYTAADKRNVRSIILNGRMLRGLVTEDDHPDWVGLTAEEMYDKLEELQKDEQSDMKKDLKDKTKVSRGTHSKEFVKGYNDAINALDYADVTDDTLENMLADLES